MLRGNSCRRGRRSDPRTSEDTMLSLRTLRDCFRGARGLALIAILGGPLAAPEGAVLWAQEPPPTPAEGTAADESPKLKPEELDALVAPVALYPDPLLAQVLVASTYPVDVMEAQQWLDQNSSLKGDELTAAAEKQSWDPSV